MHIITVAQKTGNQHRSSVGTNNRNILKEPRQNSSDASSSDMDTATFLKTILPETGIIFLAKIKARPGNPKGAQTIQYPVANAEEAAYKALELDAKFPTDNIYYAMASFKEVIYKQAGNLTYPTGRTQSNALHVKSLWLDWDVGKDDAYATRDEAVADIKRYVEATGLPSPLVVSSGYGIHTYWLFTEEITAAEWESIAQYQRLIWRHMGLKVDPACDKDCARVLRPPATHNRKAGRDVRQVKVVRAETVPLPAMEFKRRLRGYCDANGLSAMVTNDIPEWMRADAGNGNYVVERPEFAKSFAKVMVQHCKQVAMFSESGGDSEPLWYANLGVLKHCEDGEEYAHAWSSNHPTYDAGQTQTKLDQWNTGPTTCDRFKELNPTGCDGCKHQCKSPIQLGHIQTQGAEPDEAPALNINDGIVDVSPNPPPPRDFVIQDLMLAVKVAVLAGFGGVSKTQWLIQAAICIALGQPWMGKQTSAGCVLLLLCEEDSEEVARRVGAIVKAMGLTPEQCALVRLRMRVFPRAGLDTRLTKIVGGSLEHTALAGHIVSATRQLEAETGLSVRMIGLDHASMIHGGDFNAREEVMRTMQMATYIGQESRAAVLVLAHSPKGSANADKSSSADVAGSAAWVDLSRCVLVLRTMGDEDGKRFGIDPQARNEYASLTVVKNNYAKTGDAFWLRRQSVDGFGVGVLQRVELTVPEKPFKRADLDLRVAIVELVKERPGLTKTSLEGLAGVKGRLGSSRSRVRSEVELMLADGALTLRQPTPEEKSRLTIKRNDPVILTVGVNHGG